jgi:hypothetical protein
MFHRTPPPPTRSVEEWGWGLSSCLKKKKMCLRECKSRQILFTHSRWKSVSRVAFKSEESKILLVYLPTHQRQLFPKAHKGKASIDPSICRSLLSTLPPLLPSLWLPELNWRDRLKRWSWARASVCSHLVLLPSGAKAGPWDDKERQASDTTAACTPPFPLSRWELTLEFLFFLLKKPPLEMPITDFRALMNLRCSATPIFCPFYWACSQFHRQEQESLFSPTCLLIFLGARDQRRPVVLRSW